MPSFYRRTAGIGGLLIVSLGASLRAQPRGAPPLQRGGVPNPDTPSLVIGVFAAPGKELGVELGDETRSRFQGEHSAKDLFIVTKVNIENALKTSGFPIDSALGTQDMMELARITHGEFVLQGKATKAGNGLHAEASLYTKTGRETFSQPLPAFDGKDVGDVAKIVEHNTSDAMKQMPGFKACIADLRAQKYDQAVKDGNLALTAYQNSTYARICLLQAFDKLNQPDSVAVVANAILARDPSSMMALTYLLDIAQKKSDKKAVADISEKVCDLDLMNTANCKAAVNARVDAGQDGPAMARLKKLLEANPGDPELLRIEVLLELRQAAWKQAIATGKALLASDTTAATADFMNRMIGAAQKDSNSAAIIEFATMAEKKFPKDISYPQLIAQTQRKLGKLPEASAAIKRAIALDPKNTDAVVIAVNIARDMSQPDSAIAIAKRGIDAGADKAILEPVIIGPVGALVSKAQTSKERADWETALQGAQPLDKSYPSTTTKFFVGFASFQVGLDALTNARKLNDEKGKGAKEAKVKACAEAKVAEDMWATAQVAIVAGAKYSAEGAGQMMTAMQQYGELIPELKKSACGAK